ncbi:CRISPR-associated endonuclease Cas2, partial [Leptolyngbyaceae cyanobacterium UHCC 1019]
MHLVISYDISEDKRRTKIHKILKSYGQWMQFSVFECDLT